jgi:hypothetical protein
MIGNLEAYKDLNTLTKSSFAAYLLYERQSKDSKYSEYIKNLPKDFSNFPLFFTEKEKSLL